MHAAYLMHSIQRHTHGTPVEARGAASQNSLGTVAVVEVLEATLGAQAWNAQLQERDACGAHTSATNMLASRCLPLLPWPQLGPCSAGAARRTRTACKADMHAALSSWCMSLLWAQPGCVAPGVLRPRRLSACSRARHSGCAAWLSHAVRASLCTATAKA